MRRLIIIVVLVIVGMELGFKAFDALEEQVNAGVAELREKQDERREY